MKPGGFNFIVAAPDDDAGVVTQPGDVVDGFMPDVVEKFWVGRIHAASEHEFLPQEDSHLVAGVVKIVALVNSATPNAQHIHVRVAGRSDELPVLRFSNPRWKTVRRNPVGALGKYWNVVDEKSESLA